MKKITLLIISIILSLAGQAQDYKIDFTASGITNTLDSVHVKNLTQQTELTLNGTDTLHLDKNTGIGEEYKEKNKISFYPNPLKNGEGKLRFYQNKSGDTKVEVYDMEGKLLLSKQGNLQRGHNEFIFTGMPTGFFMVQVKSAVFSRSLKIISINGKQGTPKMEFVQNVQKSSIQTIANIKLIKSIIGMQFNDGEALKFTGYSNNDSVIYFHIPDKSQTINFVFGTPYPSGTVHCGAEGPAAIVDVTNPTTGETWMDRNLGASQQATSSTDSLAYGDLYHWGRFSDGHQCRNSDTTSTLATTPMPNNSNSWDGKFILSLSSNNFDWLTPQNDSLWQGLNGTNNPCPSGYRLPTKNELNSERQSWSSNNVTGAYDSPLKLPVAGGRFSSSGSPSNVGSDGYYRSSTVDGYRAYSLYFFSNNAFMSSASRAGGGSVRCLKDGSAQSPSIKIHPFDQTINDGGNASFSVYATGPSLSYQWQESTDGGTTWNPLSNGAVYSNVTTDTMNITSAPLSMDSNQYRCILIASGLPVDTSNAATLTVITTSSSYPSGTVHCISGGAAVVDVTNLTTGEIWMDRNLGASRQATSSTDSQAYGDLYQWGRFSDGHQCRNSGTTTTQSSSDTPGHSDFIKGSFDWRSPQNNNLWQGVNGTNNPCPSGYRLPTENELNNEQQSWSSNDAAGAYGSPLKLPVAGGRSYSSGSLSNVGSDGYYWSSTVSGSSAYRLYFYSNGSTLSSNRRAGGASVRCLKDGSVQPPSIKTHPFDQTINDGGNASFSVSTTGSSLSYQWQESTDGGTTWNALSNGGVYSNVTTDTMNIASATLSMDSNQYRCVLIASGLPVDTSNAATLTVISTSSSYPSGTVHCISGGAAIVDVTNPTTGETWMDRNFAASQQATSSTDSQAYGDLYQWGRFSDGHQCRNSSTTTTNATTDTANAGNSWDGKFITSPDDWLSSQNNNLWQGVNGTNNPCPSGYRLPTENELNSERQSWSSNNPAGAYSSPLKLPAAGGRSNIIGSLYSVGSSGHYWSSTVDGSDAYNLRFYSSNASMGSSDRAHGFSVRCIKDGSVQPPSIKTHPFDQTINDGGNASFSVSTTGSSLSYQWQESTDGGTTWNALSNGGVYSNVTTDTMNIASATLSMDSNQYRCVLNASGLPVDTSNAATLTVISASISYPSGTVHCISGGAAIVDVTNPTTGDTWMDRNLGASQQATSSTDSQAYGDLYQWGRFSDGHQCRNSSTTTTNATTDTANAGNSWDGKFITYPDDWLSSQNNNLWQGLNGTNNPCPSGYRLPTENELNSERQSWSSSNATGAYGSPLKLPAAGYRSNIIGSLYSVGSSGHYWSSTVDGSDAYNLRFYSSNASMGSSDRAHGFSVRCVKD